MHPADRLRAFLLETDLDTSQAAKLLGCTRAYVSLLQTKRRRPSLDVAASIERMTAKWSSGPIRAVDWTGAARAA